MHLFCLYARRRLEYIVKSLETQFYILRRFRGTICFAVTPDTNPSLHFDLDFIESMKSENWFKCECMHLLTDNLSSLTSKLLPDPTASPQGLFINDFIFRRTSVSSTYPGQSVGR